NLRYVRQIEVVLIMLGIAQWRGLGINSMFLFANIRGVQHTHPFGVGSHDAVLHSVVDHLHKMAGAVRTTVQVALFGSPLLLLGSGECWAYPLPRVPGRQNPIGDENLLSPPRRSSGITLAPAPTHRHSCQRRRNGSVAELIPLRDECRRCNTNSRRR